MNEMSVKMASVGKFILNKLKALGRTILYAMYAIFIAIVYGWVTYPTMYAMFEEGYILEAYVYNMLTIVFWLMLEKLTHRLVFLRKWLSRNLFTKVIRAMLFPKYAFVSIKSGLYLFYIYVLIQAKVLQFDLPGATDTFGRYIMAMEYGLVMLVAADMFIKQFAKDRDRIEAMDVSERAESKKKHEEDRG